MGLLLHHSVAESADRDPAHDAFRYDGTGLSYGELDDRSSRLANLLIAEGVRPHDRVGVHMLKSLELPVAIYGILKAGAAYVPIDPAAPSDRVRFMLEDCGIRHLVTDQARRKRIARLADEVPDLGCVIGAEIEAGRPLRVYGWEALAEAAAGDPGIRVVEQDLAYIMYTSGSTGVPKGLMHTHASGLAYARLSGREYGVGPTDRLGNHSPLHFDMSTFEYLTGPLRGATTVIIPEETTMFPRSLAELIERERLTFWYSVPLALIQLVDRGGLEERDTSSLRWVLFGGEPLPPKYLARLMELLPGATFSNSYGPAEVNQCTAFHVPAGPVDINEPIPIGPVWPGAEGLVLDEADEPVAPGEPGELVIRAPTMMRGYWGRPDLDRDAFLRREILPGFEGVYYRTGDLVVERPDGNLVFLGRKDRQVKVRGYRVELDEIEAVLCALPEVAEAAVVDVRSAAGVLTIVAAVLPREGTDLDAEGVRRAAATKLPGYAVPSEIEIRDALPRTGSEKVDRRAVRESWVLATD